MPIEVIGFLVFAASAIGTPGPANMVLMAAGAHFGARRSLPFLAGVILGKQGVIWLVGLGLFSVLDPEGIVFRVLQAASVAYLLWLAWKISKTRLRKAETGATVPGFLAGLIVHPLNPKAWALVIGSFATFVVTGADPIVATAAIAIGLLATQAVFQTLWMLGGTALARTVAGKPAEVWLMRTLAILMVASVIYAVFGGG